MQTVFFTIAARNYLAQAFTLFESLARVHPGCPRYLCLVDDDASIDNAGAVRFQTITIDELGLDDFEAFTFRYDLLELSTAVKPWMFRWLVRHHPDAALVYLDPDILVLDRFSAAERWLRNGASVVLTPHLLRPINDQHQPDELAILRSGAYNAGFVALNAGHPVVAAMLDWWCDRLQFDCVVDPASGRFTDQRWLDLLPGLFADVAILRDPGYNVAYWNLAQRPVDRRVGDWYAAGSRLVFVHFSGADPRRPRQFSRHQDRIDADGIGELRPLYDDYLARLLAQGHAVHATYTSPWDHFDDGERISTAHRRVYRDCHDLRSGSPIARPRTMDRSLFDLPSDAVAARIDLPVSRLMHAIWSARDDLRRAFDLGDREGRAAFIRWYLRWAGSEYGIADRHVAPIRDAYASGLSPARSSRPGSKLWRHCSQWVGSRATAMIESSVRFAPVRRFYAAIPDAFKQRIARRLERMRYARPEPTAATAREPADHAAPNGPGINLIGYARGAFGVGEMLRLIAAGLGQGGVPFSVCDFPKGEGTPQSDQRVERQLSSQRRHATNLFVINADQMGVAYDHFGRDAWDGHYNIANWAWELERFPECWDSAFELVDEFWVISHFVAGALRARTRKPVIVVPPPIAVDPRVTGNRGRFGLPVDRFVFLASFDFNSYMSRKNPLAAIAAFRLAFPAARDDVMLVIKTTNGHRHGDALRTLHAATDGDPRIEIRDELLDRDAMWCLQASCDACVSLHRSEGFGLGLAESMALGKPVVATAYSGNVDFMHADNSLLVDYTLVPLQPGDYPGWRDQRWAEPSIEHAATHLRELADDPAAARLLGAKARRSIAQTHSADSMIAVVRSRLAQIDAGAIDVVPAAAM